jgi:predicted ArsR family transcriptional regulator
MKIKSGEYITVKEMANKLKISTNTVNQRLFQHGIKPVSKDALYEISALEIIKDTIMGRPKKADKLFTALVKKSKKKVP